MVERDEPLGGRWLARGAWTCVIGATTALAMRWLSPINPLTLAATGLLPLAFVPLAAVATLGGLVGRFRLAATAIVVALASLAASAPIELDGPCQPFDDRLAARGDSIVVYSANVLLAPLPGEADRYVADIVAADADVIMLQEVAPDFRDELAADDRLSDHRVRLGSGRTLLWARFDLLEDRTEPSSESRLVSALLDGPDGPIELTSVHMAAPFVPSAVPVWEHQFERLGESVEPATQRVIAGDFNATLDHQPFRRLLTAGLRDVHAEIGCGLGLSWPIDHVAVVPVPVFALDHVLVSESLEPVSIRVGSVSGDQLGSDHHPVVAEIVVADGA